MNCYAGTVFGYHGTTLENAKKILVEGFKLDKIKCSDAGDLGRGVYLYPKTSLSFMKRFYPCILEVTAEGKFLILVPPRLYEVMEFLRQKYGCTIRNPPEKRLKAAWAWREYFLRQGYDGLLVKGWDTPVKEKGYEVVIFNLDTIKEIKVFSTKNPIFWVRNLKVEKTPWGDIEIYVKGVRFTVKKGYTPPYLWIEKARPRKGGYEIVLQLDADEELAEALDMVSTKIMGVLKEKGLTKNRKSANMGGVDCEGADR